jgi:hypothetical protein
MAGGVAGRCGCGQLGELVALDWNVNSYHFIVGTPCSNCPIAAVARAARIS